MLKVNVAHTRQSVYSSCNAACLAMLYRYFGFNQSEKEIWERLKTKRPSVKEDNFITVNNMIKDIENNNFCFVVGRSYWDIKESFQPISELLKANLPSMVIQRGHPNPKLGHSKIVIGIDESNVYVNDPEKRYGETKVSKEKFYNDWEASGKEVTGGVLLALFPKDYKKNINKLFLDDFLTNCPNLAKAISSKKI